MSGWEQQLFCERRLWHEEMERRIVKMERDVRRGSAMQQILEAERLAAKQDTTKTQVNSYEVSGESVSGF